MSEVYVLEHGLKGGQSKNHKYVSRTYKNGKWNYIYPEDLKKKVDSKVKTVKKSVNKKINSLSKDVKQTKKKIDKAMTDTQLYLEKNKKARAVGSEWAKAEKLNGKRKNRVERKKAKALGYAFEAIGKMPIVYSRQDHTSNMKLAKKAINKVQKATAASRKYKQKQRQKRAKKATSHATGTFVS